MDQEPVSIVSKVGRVVMFVFQSNLTHESFPLSIICLDKLLFSCHLRRYEYRKYHSKGLGPSRLGRDRIDKLNEIGFQWRLRPERIPWDDRFKVC